MQPSFKIGSGPTFVRTLLGRALAISIVTIGCMSNFCAARGTEAQIMRSLDMDSSSIRIGEPSERLLQHGVGPQIIDGENNRPFTTTIDRGTQYHIFVSDEHYTGTKSVGLQIDRENRPPGAPQKSKVEINIVRNDDSDLDNAVGGHFILKNGRGAFLGFAIKMDRTLYETPERWVLHFQVYQCCGVGRDGKALAIQPPLALIVEPNKVNAPNTPLDFVLMKRDDTFARNAPTHDNGERVALRTGEDHFSLDRDRWYNFIFYLKPDPGAPSAGHMQSSSGQIDMWLNGQHLVHHIGAWGYSQTVMGGVENNYAIKLGIYRAAQNRSQRIYLDDIWWSPSSVPAPSADAGPPKAQTH